MNPIKFGGPNWTLASLNQAKPSQRLFDLTWLLAYFLPGLIFRIVIQQIIAKTFQPQLIYIKI
jgi:hypothetical protein